MGPKIRPIKCQQKIQLRFPKWDKAMGWRRGLSNPVFIQIEASYLKKVWKSEQYHTNDGVTCHDATLHHSSRKLEEQVITPVEDSILIG